MEGGREGGRREGGREGREGGRIKSMYLPCTQGKYKDASVRK